MYELLSAFIYYGTLLAAGVGVVVGFVKAILG